MLIRRLIHLVPSIKGVRNTNEPIAGLQDILKKLKTQLGLEYFNQYPGTNDNINTLVDVLDFKTKPRLNNESAIKQLPKFKFKAGDYPLTENEIKNAPYLFPDSKFPIVNEDSPICNNYTKLKGPNNDLYAIANLRGITKKKALHACKWFIFHYWHTCSYFGKIIKSKPGIMIVCHNFNLFNINKKVTGDIPPQMQNTSYPFKYAVYRTRVKKLLRKNFMDLYLKDKQFAENYSGFYKFSVSVYPETKEDLNNFNQNLQKCLEKVSRLDLNTLEEESNKELSTIPWNEIDKILKRNHINNFPFQRMINKKKEKRYKTKLDNS